MAHSTNMEKCTNSIPELPSASTHTTTESPSQPPLYSELQNLGEIRILDISSSQDSDEISCRFHTVNLNSNPIYYALSYVWGDRTRTQFIECNGKRVQVTVNLAAAMIQLGSRYSGKHFWIDALSIDQENLKERAQQVGLMGRIYECAENVVIYLGEESTELSIAMELFDKIHELAVKHSTSPENPSQIRECLPKPHDRAWYRFHDFFNRPWFSRIWVVQEVALASGDPDVICGPFSLRWSSVIRVATFFHESALANSTSRQSRSFNAAIMQSFKTDVSSLLPLLQRTRRFLSTDPRDMLFALYGIIRLQERVLLESPYFQVNYERSVKDIYRNAVIGFIKYFASVEIICEVSGHDESAIEGIPSWVPDWSVARKWRRDSFGYGANYSGYDACAGQPALVATTENPDILRLAGKYHDAVAWVAQPFEDADLSLLPYRRNPRTFEKLWDTVSGRLGKTRQTSEAFWRTLIANADRHRRRVSPDYYRYFLKYWHESKLHDERSLRYPANKAIKTGILDEDEDRCLFEKATREIDTEITIEEFESLKRYTERLAAQFLPCKSRPGSAQLKSDAEDGVTESQQESSGADVRCPHCEVIDVPDSMLRNGKMVIKGHSPALTLRDIDPFIDDFFHNLESSNALITADANTYYHTRLTNCLPTRTFFITKAGLMGLGPRETEAGDRIVIMSGSRVPLLLRSTGIGRILLDETASKPRLVSQYKLIGDCYVYGIMGGEAVKDVNWADDYEIFDLV